VDGEEGDDDEMKVIVEGESGMGGRDKDEGRRWKN
jgi:hypothetical protein